VDEGEEQGHGQEGQVDEDLARHGRGLVAQQAREHGAHGAVHGQLVAHVEHHRLQVVPHAAFVQLAQHAGQQARGHQENEQARVAKEAAQVEPHAARVQPPADRHRHRDAGQRAHGRLPAAALLEHGQQEEHRFQPLARHGQEHHADERPALPVRALRERLVDGGLQLALDGARSLAHPEHHRGQHDHGDEPDHAFEQLLLLLRKLRRQQLQAGTGEQRQRRGQQHADPHCGHQRAAPALLEVAGNDADDQRGFDAFAQHDEKGDEHRLRKSGREEPSGAGTSSSAGRFSLAPGRSERG
jgi:hypothetical protein